MRWKIIFHQSELLNISLIKNYHSIIVRYLNTHPITVCFSLFSKITIIKYAFANKSLLTY